MVRFTVLALYHAKAEGRTMSLKKLQIPTGMQDTLPGECEARNTLEERFRRLFLRQF